MNKINALIIFGGVSNEYEVSLRSVCTIIDNIDRNKYNPIVVGITRDGQWLLSGENTEKIKADKWQQNATPAILSPDRKTKGILVFEKENIKTVPIDVAFIACHGQNCEDGTLQGFFKLAGIPFSGSDVTSSSICFDKEFTHIIAQKNSIPMAKWIAVTKNQAYDEILLQIEKDLGFPAFIKPANSGSSVGTCPIMTKNDLKDALKTAFKHDKKAIIEEHIKAHEVECAVMGNNSLEAPETGEIVSQTGFYDYNAKYCNNSAKLLIPANISENAQNEVKEIAKKAYKTLNCTGYARVDFFVTDNDKVILNEINTLPGFTSISMFPQMMCHKLYTLKELITKLLTLAMEE